MGRSRGAKPRVLAVSQDEAFVEQFRPAFAAACEFEVLGDVAQASTRLTETVLDGVLLDGRLPERAALFLAHGFLGHQAAGRVALVARSEDSVTLITTMQLSFADRRIEVFFRPADPAEVLGFFLAGVPAAT